MHPAITKDVGDIATKITKETVLVRKISAIAVDSGQILIADPCHSVGITEDDYRDLCESPTDDEDMEPFGDDESRGVTVVSTLGGDMIYPVYLIEGFLEGDDTKALLVNISALDVLRTHGKTMIERKGKAPVELKPF